MTDCAFTRHNPGKPMPQFSPDQVYIRVKGNKADIGLLQFGSTLNQIVPDLTYDPTPYYRRFCHINQYEQKLKELREEQ